MVISLKNRIIIGVLCLLAVLLLTGCATDAPDKETDGTTTVPAVTEPPAELDADAHFCTVLDNATGQVYSPVSANGEYRFYLPGGVDSTHLILNCFVGENYSVTVNGTTFTESIGFRVNASENDEMTVTFTDGEGNAATHRYTFFASSANILCLEIDESLGSIKAMNADKNQETYCYGSLSYVSTDSRYNFDSAFSLKGRGNATWDDEKKGYALKLYDSAEYDSKNKISISGMGESANWVLLANHRDRTLIRNALAQTLAQKLGMENAVEFVFVDLYVNGEYLGLYNLMQKIESGKEQVDITEAETDSPDGGYLLEFDNYSDTPQIKLKKSGQRVTVKSPDDLESYTAIEKLLNDAEAAITDPYGYNWNTGLYWDDYIDVESFAILWIVREYTMDNDATVNFRFYYDPADGKFHAGPAWDFDNAMARNTGVFADPEFALIDSGYRNPQCWLRKLMEFDAFKEEIVRLYREHRDLFTTAADSSIYTLAYRYADELSYSIAHNFTVWEKQLSNKNWNNPDEPTYEGHFEILTDFLEERNEFWRTYIPGLVD